MKTCENKERKWGPKLGTWGDTVSHEKLYPTGTDLTGNLREAPARAGACEKPVKNNTEGKKWKSCSHTAHLHGLS